MEEEAVWRGYLVHRRIGGLEIMRNVLNRGTVVHRRIGGLEIPDD